MRLLMVRRMNEFHREGASVMRVGLGRMLVLTFSWMALVSLWGCGGAKGPSIDTISREVAFEGGTLVFTMIGGHQDGTVEHALGSPFIVRVEGRGVDVPAGLGCHWSVVEGAKAGFITEDGLKSEIETPFMPVASNGGGEGGRIRQASVWLKLSSRMGENRVLCEVLHPGHGVLLRSTFKATAIDYWKLVFWIFGGLGMFLYGMKLMSDSLHQIAGDRLKNVLERLTSNPWMGLCVGAAVTAIIQSSSAMTVMLIGFINAGIMTLAQTVPMIFGANIGTTVTAQIVAFKITKYALPAIGLGFFMNMISSRRKWQNLGLLLLGFGLLFLGMETMSEVCVPLRGSRMVMDSLLSFSRNSLAGFLCGAVVTAVLQSSSATVGLTIVLANAGLLTLDAAWPLILGMNVGTTITAVIASINTTVSARRSACVHVVFNLLGSFIMLAANHITWHGHPAFLSFVDWLTPGDPFVAGSPCVARHIANAHTCFNVLFSLLFMPFVPMFVALSERLVPGRERISRLEPHLLENPSIALSVALKEVHRMGRLVEGMVVDAFNGFFYCDERWFDGFSAREEEVDRLQAELSSYIARIFLHELPEKEADRLPRILHTVNDFERIADLCENVMEEGERRISRKLVFSLEAEEHLRRMFELVHDMAVLVLEGIHCGDEEILEKARGIELEINRLDDEYRRQHIKRLKERRCDPVAGIMFLEVLSNLEKMGDHYDNVAEAFSE